MKMELSVSERLSLLSILPQQGNIVTYRLILGLRGMLSLSETEIVKLMPTYCHDISKGCPLCGGTEWEDIPFAPMKKCKGEGCNFRAGIGQPESMVWRSLDDEGQPVSDIADMEFGEAGMQLFVETLTMLNAKEQLNDNTAPLYIKFVEKNGKQGAIEGAAG